ncbi:MAG: CoA-binding protein [Caldilineaceae bacterium]
MATLDELVQDFLAQKHIAVVGVSDKRETGCNAAYRKFKEAGYHVSAVNPRLTSYEGDPCYPDLMSIPQKPDAVFMLTSLGLVLAVAWLAGGQLFAVVTGLASGETEPVGWLLSLALSTVVLYTLSVVEVGVTGSLLVRDLFAGDTEAAAFR